MADELDIIGEVIEASTTEFVAESRELHSPPAFGSFVKVLFNNQRDIPAASPQEEEDPFRDSQGKFNQQYYAEVQGEPSEAAPSDLQSATYAVVYQAGTSPVDTGRRLRAYWKDEEQLDREQPERGEWLLMTDFKSIVIGYSSNGSVRQILPPQPPKLNSFVYPCTAREIRLITSRMDFLRTLAGFRNAPTEEVVAACIREAHAAHGGDFEFLVAAGKELAGLLKDDYDCLQAIMRRVAP